ncbi:MAG: GLUG motif-containing protein [Planctomycetota bacterium]|jgi:hypothetical protein
MKQVIIPIMAVLLCVLCFSISPVQAKYGGGYGGPYNPYLIYTAEQMNAIGADANDWDKHFKLMADIDLSGYTGPGHWPPSTFARNPSPPNGSIISDLDTDLYWTTGSGATSHDVYFGTSNPPPFIHNQTPTTFDPGTIAYLTKYYWRIDEVNNTGKTTGIVWSFTTIKGPPPMPTMIADVDVSVDIGKTFNIIGYFEDWESPNNIPFTGVFDGSGHTISNFTYTCTDTDFIGLFVYVEGEIKDLGLLDPNIDVGTGGYVGSLVGFLRDGTIANCYVKDGSVSRSGHVGGLVGLNWRGRISNCYSNASVLGVDIVGGLVGINDSGTITNCYSTGSVTGYQYIGGLVGSNWGSTINNCYSTGSVTGYQYIGGLVGDNREDTVTFSFWDIETSGLTNSAGGTGLTTAQMQTANTFIGWWCGSVWTIDEGVDYPRLDWENKPGELITAPFDFYGGGTGEPNDPYLIYTAEQLNNVGLIPCTWDKCFKLMADVDLGGFTGTEFNLIGRWIDYVHRDNRAFTGLFDGNGHTISYFSYTSTGRDWVGLFEYVSGEIKNLGLIYTNINAGTGNNVGSLVGRLRGGTITNCYSTGSVSGQYRVGGLVGYNYQSTIGDCYSTGSVSGKDAVGGLVGLNSGTISNCYSHGSVSGQYEVGGLVGLNSGTITKCYSTGDVGGNWLVGGLVGENHGTITNCYATCSVWGGRFVGGLVGENNATIRNCYSTGSITADRDFGGHVGYNTGTISASFWDVNTSGRDWSSGGTGLSTVEMQMEDTFTDAGWDFNTPVWTIDEGVDYPRLRWEFVFVLNAAVRIIPRTINLASKGNWITCYIWLPEQYNVVDIDPNSIFLEDEIKAEELSVDEQNQVAIARFSREEFRGIINTGEVELTISGRLKDGTVFEATDVIRVINEGRRKN